MNREHRDPPHSSDSKESPASWQSLLQSVTYGLSLPERTLRATSAMVGGALRESANLLVPQSFRSSRSYATFVAQALDFVTEQVGGVERPQSTEPSATASEDFLARKTIGNFVDLAGIATLHLSPLTILAVLSDVAYGSKTFLHELSAELKKEGIIPADSTIDRAADLLEAVRHASGTAASAIDTPPLSLEGLQTSIEQTRAAVAKLDPTVLMPQAELEGLWKEMRAVAAQQQIGLFDLSSAMTLFAVRRVGEVGGGALSTVRVAGNLFDRHILQHYADSLRTIRERGYYETVSEVGRPYLDAVWKNYSGDRPTLTEDLLTGRTLDRAWQGVTGWLASPTVRTHRSEPSGQASTTPPASTSTEIDQDDTLLPLHVTLAPGLEGLQVATFSVHGASIRPSTADDVRAWERWEQGVLAGDAHGGEERRQALRGLLRRGGYKPSGRGKPAQEYLLGVLRRDGALPRILGPVDALNAFSVASGLPISMLALDRVGRDWRLRVGRKEERFVFNSVGQEIDVEGCIVIEGEGVSGPSAVASPIKDSAYGKVVEGDTAIGVCLYASDEAVEVRELENWARQLAAAIAKTTGGRASRVTVTGT